MELAYVAHSERCALLLDAGGVCRWVIPKNAIDGASLAQAERCIGAQFVAALDRSTEGLLVHQPRVGAHLLFARHDGGRISVVRFGPLVQFDALDDTQGETAPEEAPLDAPAAAPEASPDVAVPYVAAVESPFPEPEVVARAPARLLPDFDDAPTGVATAHGASDDDDDDVVTTAVASAPSLPAAEEPYRWAFAQPEPEATPDPTYLDEEDPRATPSLRHSGFSVRAVPPAETDVEVEGSTRPFMREAPLAWYDEDDDIHTIATRRPHSVRVVTGPVRRGLLPRRSAR